MAANIKKILERRYHLNVYNMGDIVDSYDDYCLPKDVLGAIREAIRKVFDDIEQMKGFETYHRDKWVCHIKDYLAIKKHHLSP